MVHAERQDCRTGNDWLDAKQENLVESEAASRLISIHDLLDAARWCRSLWELAEHLVVDEQMLLTRLRMLSRRQAEQLRIIGEGWWSA